MTTYKVVIELKCVYPDGREEILHSIVCGDDKDKSIAEETMMELMTHAEQY